VRGSKYGKTVKFSKVNGGAAALQQVSGAASGIPTTPCIFEYRPELLVNAK